ncbi:MAG: hypothetical protein R3B84_17150 [Zavarzinella sp.]
MNSNITSFSEWEQAANNGIAEAMILVGDCFEEGVLVKQDYFEAMR